MKQETEIKGRGLRVRHQGTEIEGRGLLVKNNHVAIESRGSGEIKQRN